MSHRYVGILPTHVYVGMSHVYVCMSHVYVGMSCVYVTFPLILTERFISVSGQSRHICKNPKCYGNRCLSWSHTAEYY